MGDQAHVVKIRKQYDLALVLHTFVAHFTRKKWREDTKYANSPFTNYALAKRLHDGKLLSFRYSCK
jgi:hypothetical protein